MRSPKRFFALITGLVIGIGAMLAVQSLTAGPGAVRDDTQPAAVNEQALPLVGEEYAKSLGLPTIPELSDACEYAAEAPPGEDLYCMDPVADTDVEARLIGWRINGHIPSEEEEQLAELFSEEDAIPDTPENEAKLLEIRDQIAQLMEQIHLAKNA
ncbi:MAG TPA: hypothetical protein VFQ40_00035 [Actinomycetota bacterium]|nr:hypothetical protein [Actinomycetota bacterium]